MINSYIIHDTIDPENFASFDYGTVYALNWMGIIEHTHNEVVQDGKVTVHHYQKRA